MSKRGLRAYLVDLGSGPKAWAIPGPDACKRRPQGF